MRKTLKERLQTRIENYVGPPDMSDSIWGDRADRRLFLQWVWGTVRLARKAESEKILNYLRATDALFENLKRWKCTGYRNKELKKRVTEGLGTLWPTDSQC
jgi:hypothetical protein